MARVIHLLQGLRRGGMERGTLELIQRARAAGHDDRLVLYDTPPDASCSYDPPPGDACVFLPRAGKNSLAYAAALRAYLGAVHARIVHAHNQTALFYAAVACLGMPARSAPRVIGTFHNRPVSRSWCARQATRWAAGRADAVFSVSGYLARWLVRGKWSKNCEVIHSDVDTESFTPAGPRMGLRQRLGLSPETLLVGHVGRFDDNKRQEDLVDAFRRIRGSVPAAALVLGGEGPRRRALEAATDRGDSIHFIGVLDDVAAFMRDIDVFVLCSLHEGLPRVLLEALACNRVVVTTRIDAITEVLGEDAHGLQVTPECPQELAHALTVLLTNPPLRQTLAAGGREKVLARFSAELHFRSYERAYSNLLGRREAHAPCRPAAARDKFRRQS